MKSIIVIAVSLFSGILTVNAQFGISNFDDVYTVDQEIPSYFFPSEKDVENSKKAPMRGERNMLERLLSLNDKTTAVLVDTLTDFAGGFHESYSEYYNGIEVEGSRCTIHYDKEGNITSVNGNFRTIQELNTVPAISEDAALQYALSDIGAIKYAWEDAVREQMLKNIKEDQKATYYPKGNVVVFANQEGISLAYKFYVESTNPVSHLYIYVDAESGRILGKYKATCEVAATTTVTTLFSGQRTITTDSYSGGYRLRDYTRGNGILTYDHSTENDYTSTNNSWSGMSNYDRAALDAHWGVETTYDFYLNKFGRNSYDNNGAVLRSYVNKQSYANACWNTAYNVMVYGINSNNNPFVGIDVTAHELTHAVTGATSGLVGFGEQGALNEGLSDAFAVCVENDAKPNNGSLIWAIGEDVQAGGFRNLSNPTCKFYRGTGWNNPYSSSGEVHINSGVFGYWFYLLANGGSGTTETGINYNVTGIGLDKAIRICYLMNVSYLTWIHTYTDARDCSYLAANQLGYTDDIEQIRNAWIAVGLDFPSTVDVDGAFALCGITDFSIANLPSGYNVSWQINGGDSQNFPFTTSGNLCTVTPLVTNVYKESNLQASITYHGYIVKSFTKKIYTHETSLYVSGCQDDYTNGSFYYPEQTFSVSANNASNGYSSNQILINTDCDIHLTSTRFKGMNISFDGSVYPTNISHNGDRVSFHTMPDLFPSFPGGGLKSRPIVTSQYNLAVVASTEDGCRDFTINFVVSAIEEHAPELLLEVSGNTLSAFLTVAIPESVGGGFYQEPTWTLSIIRPIPAQTLRTVTVTGSTAYVDISGLSSGIYIVRAVYQGQTYSSKFLK